MFVCILVATWRLCPRLVGVDRTHIITLVEQRYHQDYSMLLVGHEVLEISLGLFTMYE